MIGKIGLNCGGELWLLFFCFVFEKEDRAQRKGFSPGLFRRLLPEGSFHSAQSDHSRKYSSIFDYINSVDIQIENFLNKYIIIIY